MVRGARDGFDPGGGVVTEGKGSLRVVSMLPAATEIVGALGMADVLVGVSHECDHPESVRDRSRVTEAVIDVLDGPGREIDEAVRRRLAEGLDLYVVDETLLRELRPDLILTQELCTVCAPSRSGVAELAATLPERPRVMNLEPSRLEEVFVDIERVAGALGDPERGRTVVRALRERVDEVRGRASEAVSRPRIALLEWLDPPFASGHWNPELVQIAGGVEALGRAGEPSRQISWNEVAEVDPELLVVACCGWSVDRTLTEWRSVRREPRVADLTAVGGGDVWVVDGSAYFSRPGPRLVDSLEILAGILHPELFDLRAGVRVGASGTR